MDRAPPETLPAPNPFFSNSKPSVWLAAQISRSSAPRYSPGDTAGAQQAYGALVALGKNGPNSNGAVFQRSDRAQAFDAIGSALRSGDLAGARQAFTALASSFEHQPPVPTSTPASTPPEIVTNLGGASGQSGANPEVIVNINSANNTETAVPEEIQINFGSGAAGGQLKIDVSQTQNGEHITLDFLQPNKGLPHYPGSVESPGKQFRSRQRLESARLGGGLRILEKLLDQRPLRPHDAVRAQMATPLERLQSHSSSLGKALHRGIRDIGIIRGVEH